MSFITTENTKHTEIHTPDLNSLSGQVIESAIQVHRQLGPGLLPNFNEKLLKNGIKRMRL